MATLQPKMKLSGNGGQKSVFDSVARQETQLAILETVVRVLYTVQDIWNVLHYDATQKTLELYGNYRRRCQNTMEDRPELDGKEEKLVETTGYRTVQARLTPTLTHVVTRNPVTSGAKNRAMSLGQGTWAEGWTQYT